MPIDKPLYIWLSIHLVSRPIDMPTKLYIRYAATLDNTQGSGFHNLLTFCVFFVTNEMQKHWPYYKQSLSGVSNYYYISLMNLGRLQFIVEVSIMKTWMLFIWIYIYIYSGRCVASTLWGLEKRANMKSFSSIDTDVRPIHSYFHTRIHNTDLRKET